MRVVTPFRPFPAVSDEHRALGPFDWSDAITMLRESVRRSCRCQTVVLTDQDSVATVPGPVFAYRTTERDYLMLWILEVSLRYLESDDFTEDTAFCSPDVLVFRDLHSWFAGDFGIVVRKHRERPILNSVQWWSRRGKDRLIALYRDAIRIARKSPEASKVWGADSEPFRKLLKPLRPGCGPKRDGLVVNLVDHRDVLEALTSAAIETLRQGQRPEPARAVIDFRYLRKHYMRAYYDATIGATA